MNKNELIAAVANRTAFTKVDSEHLVNAVLDTITQQLAAGEKVQLIGFGTFEVKERAAHIGRNPQTNELMNIEASRNVSFKAGKALKDAISE